MDSKEVAKLNVKSNLYRILELLEVEEVNKKWNCENIELRQRLKLLRKDSLRLEKRLRGF